MEEDNLDDLEDMLQDTNIGIGKSSASGNRKGTFQSAKPAGGLDDLEDLDDMLDGLGNQGYRKPGNKPKNVIPAARAGSPDEDIDDLWGGAKVNKSPIHPVNQQPRIPSASNKGFEASIKRQRPSNTNQTPTLLGAGGRPGKKTGLTDVENLLCEAYNLILRD